MSQQRFFYLTNPPPPRKLCLNKNKIYENIQEKAVVFLDDCHNRPYADTPCHFLLSVWTIIRLDSHCSKHHHRNCNHCYLALWNVSRQKRRGSTRRNIYGEIYNRIYTFLSHFPDLFRISNEGKRVGREKSSNKNFCGCTEVFLFPQIFYQPISQFLHRFRIFYR